MWMVALGPAVAPRDVRLLAKNRLVQSMAVLLGMSMLAPLYVCALTQQHARDADGVLSRCVPHDARFVDGV